MRAKLEAEASSEYLQFNFASITRDGIKTAPNVTSHVRSPLTRMTIILTFAGLGFCSLNRIRVPTADTCPSINPFPPNIVVLPKRLTPHSVSARTAHQSPMPVSPSLQLHAFTLGFSCPTWRVRVAPPLYGIPQPEWREQRDQVTEAVKEKRNTT
ncbi:hypothetical protein EVAR_33129_1 [Eumeta japonica]|uniref:Uncharacterized protein n=1 Tax=Eumeta variegata TaxID=151549 RepID=A0A4C1Y728_EUMVA|nr:hypothetical protein EVAR_33129_1 [Eumeta japonica]